MKKSFAYTLFLCFSLFASLAYAQAVEVDASTRVVESIKSEEVINYSAISQQINALEESLKNGQYN